MFDLSFLSVSGSGSTLPDPDPLVRGMDPDPDPSMRLLQKSEYTTLSRPQQHSHSREKVLVDRKGLEIALEAVRVSVEAVRVHSHGLNWHSQRPLQASHSRPLKHLKASIDTLTASTDTLTASTDTLTASKALSRPLQSTSTQLACNREFTSTFSRLWECCWGQESASRGCKSFKKFWNKSKRFGFVPKFLD